MNDEKEMFVKSVKLDGIPDTPEINVIFNSSVENVSITINHFNNESEEKK